MTRTACLLPAGHPIQGTEIGSCKAWHTFSISYQIRRSGVDGFASVSVEGAVLRRGGDDGGGPVALPGHGLAMVIAPHPYVRGMYPHTEFIGNI